MACEHDFTRDLHRRCRRCGEYEGRGDRLVIDDPHSTGEDQIAAAERFRASISERIHDIPAGAVVIMAKLHGDPPSPAIYHSEVNKDRTAREDRP